MSQHCDICDTSYNTDTHKCSDRQIEYIVHKECQAFDCCWKNFLVSNLGRFTVYCAQRLINGSSEPNNTLVI